MENEKQHLRAVTDYRPNFPAVDAASYGLMALEQWIVREGIQGRRIGVVGDSNARDDRLCRFLRIFHDTVSFQYFKKSISVLIRYFVHIERCTNAISSAFFKLPPVYKDSCGFSNVPVLLEELARRTPNLNYIVIMLELAFVVTDDVKSIGISRAEYREDILLELHYIRRKAFQCFPTLQEVFIVGMRPVLPEIGRLQFYHAAM